MTPPQYRVSDADLSRDRDAVVSVWDGSIGWAGRLPEMFDAFYRDCPLGQPLLKLLHHQPENTVIGTIGAGPRRILWRGQEIRAGVVSHLAVLPAHRSVKPGIFLSRSLVEMARGRFDVLYGLPSSKGAALAKLAGFKVGGQLIRQVKILRYQNYIDRVLPQPASVIGGALINFANQTWDRMRRLVEAGSAHAEWVNHVDPRMDRLWQQSPHGERWTSIRDATMLHWRFDRLPSARRRYLLLSPIRDGELTAWFACDTNVHDPHMLSVNDFWTIDGVQAVDPVSIRTLCRAAYREGFHSIELRFTGSEEAHASWSAEGFVERSRQPLIVIWLNQELAGETEGMLHITDIENDG
ncbi:MAG: hypothetical protein WC617_02840 [Rhodanobacter sp.]